MVPIGPAAEPTVAASRLAKKVRFVAKADRGRSAHFLDPPFSHHPLPPAILCGMSDVTRKLSQLHSSDPQAAEKLLPQIYNELKKLAAAKLAKEKPGQTLQATALVHEAYARLVGNEQNQGWDSRGHFF